MNPDTAALERAATARRPRRGAGTASRKKQQAIDRFLDAGERMIADKWIEGVAMREVARAAGSANHFAVQYRFGTLEGLVRAIYERRQPALEARRRALLEAVLRPDRPPCLRTLIDVLLRPLFELCNDSDERVFVRVLWQIRKPRPLPFQLPFPRPSQSAALETMIRTACAPVPDELFAIRSRIAYLTFLDAVVCYDVARRTAADGVLPPGLFLTCIIDIVAAVFEARTSPEVLGELGR